MILLGLMMILRDKLPNISMIIIRLILFIWILLLVSIPLVFTLISVIGTPIGTIAVIIALMLNLFISKFLFLTLDEKLYKNCFNGLYIFIILITMFYLYGINYSPILEIRQDPSVYLYKALNIINYGTLEQPLTYLKELIDHNILNVKEYTGYAKILNGTSYNNGILSLDFFQFPSYFYAFIGIIDKNYMFITPFIVNSVSAILLYFIFLNYITKCRALIFSLLFFITPAVLWFGRAPFSEPSALLAILSIFFIFEYIKNENSQYIMLFIISIFAFFTRIDLIILLYISIFYITYKNRKIGLLFTIIAILFIYLNALNSEIYMTRISATSIVFMYYYILPIVFLLGIVMSKIIVLDKFIKSNVFLIFLLLFFTFLLLFMFRDDFTTVNEIVYMHGREMRTYNEMNMEKIFLVIPDFIVVIGMLYFPFLIKNANLKRNSFIIMTPLFIVFSYYIYNISNSPQMYWSVRRYLYVLLPLLYISYVLFVSKQSKLSQNILLAMTTFLVLNQNLRSQVAPEMKGLDNSVKTFISMYPESKYDLILYDKKLRYPISSILSYGKYQFIPINNINEVLDIYSYFKNKKNILYITNNKLKIPNKKFTIDYTRVGESYIDLPKAKQYKKFTFNVYSDVYSIDNKKKLLFASKGFYNDNVWTNGNLILQYINFNILNNKFLKIETYGYAPKFFKRVLNVSTNGIKLKMYKKEKNTYYFYLDSRIENIDTININSNTFIPKKLGINGDTRVLGIDLKSIQLIKDLPK
jgi:hypothetical protein